MIHEFVRMCESVGMAQTVCVLPPAEDHERLLAVVADRNRPLKHVQRARIWAARWPTDRLAPRLPTFSRKPGISETRQVKRRGIAPLT
jgi:hypothetical protein